MISDTALDGTPGLQPVNGKRVWTRNLTPAQKSTLDQMLTQMALVAPWFGGSISDFATDEVALDSSIPEAGAHLLGPFVCVQKIGKGPASQVKPYDSSVPNAAFISAVDMSSPYTWSQEPDQNS